MMRKCRRFVVDRIVKNYNIKDLWAADIIIEATVARTRLMLLSTSSVWIVFENARTYQNDIIPVMPPFIYRAHGFVLRGFIDPETAVGKSLVDAHFATAKRQIHRYVKEAERNVTAPEDIVTALHHDGGISNCAVELISVLRDGDQLQRWRDGVRGRHITPLRTGCECQ